VPKIGGVKYVDILFVFIYLNMLGLLYVIVLFLTLIFAEILYCIPSQLGGVYGGLKE